MANPWPTNFVYSQTFVRLVQKNYNPHCPVPGNCTNGELRLTGGTNPREGTVEICINRFWGTICDTMWDNRDAQVVCRQLGFPSTGEIYLKFIRSAIILYFLYNAYRGKVIFKCSLWIWKWFLASWSAWLHWKRTNPAQLLSQWNRSHLILLWPWWWCWCQMLRLVHFSWYMGVNFRLQ